jgi:flagellar hook-associated protein FlgK
MNIFTSPTLTSGSPLQHALTGMSRSRDQFHNSAIETVQSFVEQANALSNGDTALSSASFVSSLATSPETSMVNMMQAQHAFEANLKVFSAVDEMQQKVLDIIT